LTVGRNVLNNGTLTLSSSSGGNINVGGNWTNNSTFTNNSRTVTFNGVAAQTIGGSVATAFSSLVINNSAGVTLNTSTDVGGSVSTALTLTTDLTVTAPDFLNETGVTVANSSGLGDVLGDVRRTDVNATAKPFGNANVQIAVPGPAIQVDVNLAKGAPGGFAAAVSRGYSIVTGGAVSGATVRLHYLDSELNGNAEGSLTLWRATGSPVATWTDQGFNSRDGAANYVEKTGVTGFSEWTLAASPSAPTAVKLQSFTATRNGDEVMLQWRTGYEAHNLGYVVYREVNGQRVAITPSLVAGSALVAGNQARLRAGLS